MSYIGQVCWKTRGTKCVYKGHTLETRWRNKWLEVLVQWHHTSSTSWEKVANLGFDSPLPQVWSVTLKQDVPVTVFTSSEWRARKMVTDFLLECCYKEERFDIEHLSYQELVAYCESWGIAEVQVKAVPVIQ